MRNLVRTGLGGQRGKGRLHAALLGGASALVIGAIAGPALAQDSSSAVETVVVTGIRASLQSAQAIKQNSDQIVDSITAVDIGALPDRNVADALQRVPGVTLQRTDQNRDPVRYGGTGNGVYIRGLAWVEALTNGRDEFSASNGRSLSFADVSADLLSGVDVYKNPDAKMIEGGIGGVVNLKTRKPFDQDGLLIAASGDVTYSDLAGKGSPSANVLISDRWNTHIGEIGALFSADYQQQENFTNGISTSHYDCLDATDTVGGTSVYGSTTCNSISAANRRYIPNYFDWRQIDWQQKRLAFDSSVQWRPSERLEFTLEGFYSKADPHDTEFSLPFNVIQDPKSGQVNYTYDKNGVWTGGTITNGQTGGIDTRIGQHHDSNADFSLNGKWNPTDHWTFSADVQYVESRATNYSMTGYDDLGNPNDGSTPGVPGEVLSMNVGGSLASGSVSNPDAMTKPENYYYSAAMDHLENNFAHSWAYRADGSYTFDDENGWLKSVDFGFRGENKQAVTRQTGYNWSLLSHQSWGGGPPVFDTQTGYSGGPQNADLPKQVGLHKFGSFLGGSAPAAWFSNPSLLNQGTAHAYSFLKDTESAGWGWTPYASQQASCAGQVDYKCEAIYSGFTPESDNVSAGVNDQKENTIAGYAMLSFGHDGFLGTALPIDGNIGVRVVQTRDNTSAGKLILNVPTSGCSMPPATSCNDYITAFSFLQTGTVTNPSPPPATIPVYGGTVPLPAAKNTYTDILPSVNVRVHLTDQLQARVAFSQSVVRPDFSFTQNFESVGFGFGQSNTASEGTFDPVTTGRTGTGGNPYLKPMHANNFDASIEWYFAPTGNLTFAIFHKDISDYFLTGPVPVTLTRNGITETFQVTSTLNGSKGKVEGLELGYQQFYDTLPGIWGGFGVSANYTKIYNSGGANPTVNLFETVEIGNAQTPLPLEGMSPDSYNIQLLYEKFGISGRLAYNWRSRFLLTSSAANVNQPVWSENYGQLDGSIFYSFLDHYKIGVEATNLLHTTTILDVGYADFHPRYDWIDADRKVAIVMRANW